MPSHPGPPRPILTPEQFIRGILTSASSSTLEEHKKLVEHAHAHAVVTYSGDVPESVQIQFRKLDEITVALAAREGGR